MSDSPGQVTSPSKLGYTICLCILINTLYIIITGCDFFFFGMKLKNYFGCTDVCIAWTDHKIQCTKFSQLKTNVTLLQWNFQHDFFFFYKQKIKCTASSEVWWKWSRTKMASNLVLSYLLTTRKKMYVMHVQGSEI